MPPSTRSWPRNARLFVQLKRAGTPVPGNDLWIASLALEYDLLLITRDQHLQHTPQLPRRQPCPPAAMALRGAGFRRGWRQARNAGTAAYWPG